MTSVGKQYEQLAADYLCNCGYTILNLNYRTRFGEVDIIAQKDNCIIFVEVKYRANTKYGNPCEAVNYYKQKKLIATAQLYLCSGDDRQCRFDIIEITGGTIRHLINAFSEV
ncbi:MAG: YraN family protein [Epulopiscium sp. Nuni2H_MBin001]|nr:MAG: YraN family protein [Epulopiscium sp. Nuni2H_MBin001]